MRPIILRQATIAAALLLAAVFVGCKPQNNYGIYVIEQSKMYAVYDSNMHLFIYRDYCDTPKLDKDSIVIDLIKDSSHYCYKETKTFTGYSTKDSAEIAASSWRKYGYEPEASNSR